MWIVMRGPLWQHSMVAKRSHQTIPRRPHPSASVTLAWRLAGGGGERRCRNIEGDIRVSIVTCRLCDSLLTRPRTTGGRMRGPRGEKERFRKMRPPVCSSKTLKAESSRACETLSSVCGPLDRSTDRPKSRKSWTPPQNKRG